MKSRLTLGGREQVVHQNLQNCRAKIHTGLIGSHPKRAVAQVSRLPAALGDVVGPLWPLEKRRDRVEVDVSPSCLLYGSEMIEELDDVKEGQPTTANELQSLELWARLNEASDDLVVNQRNVLETQYLDMLAPIVKRSDQTQDSKAHVYPLAANAASGLFVELSSTHRHSQVLLW